ncbi:MAG: UDP-N-acetylglucosamine 2-epimerase (non-hydrolyzing) [Candidatus Bathyarchaeota archaeon]|nr:UDP-N-acetylglucosamine 2-epimerase (non-hydrolyzing) [Candidatus Bathyarchaeota archaeon]
MACVFGTRPEIIKFAPIIWAAKEHPEIELLLIHTGQHYDYTLSKAFMDDFHLPKANYNLKVGSKSSLKQIARLIDKLEGVLSNEKPDVLLIQGDTNTVPAAALVSRNLGICLCHVEAGLRSFNERSWEEINRRIAGACAFYHFAPTEIARSMLRSQGIDDKNIFVTGNTIVDAIEEMAKNLYTPSFLKKLPKDKSILITIHRAENTETQNLTEIIGAVERISETCNVIFPLHPRTRLKLEAANLYGKLERNSVLITEPLDYVTFLSVLVNVDLVLTDSGGVQEEAAILGKPTITARPSTPRWESVFAGNNRLVKPVTASILEAFNMTVKEDKCLFPANPNLFGKPGAGRRILEILLELHRAKKLEYPVPDFAGKSPEQIAYELRRYIAC